MPAPIDDATLQAFADTIIPGRKATDDRPRRRDPPARDRRRRLRARRGRGRRAAPLPRPADRLRRARAARSSPTSSARSLPHGGAVPALTYDAARAGAARAASTSTNPTASLCEAAAAVPFTAFCAAGDAPDRARAQNALRLPRDGLSGRRAERLPARLQLPPQARPRAHRRTGNLPLMAERVDVCIVGSGFGGSITAWRLAELYEAAGVDPKNILVLERGRRFKHTEFQQSMAVDHLSGVYNLIQSTGRAAGAQVVIANAVGGGSNLYLAASLRSPSEIFERRDHRPDDGPDRRMWPHADLARHAQPVLRARRARAARAPAELEPGVEVGRPVGGDARRGGPHLRPRAARDRLRPLRRRQVVPHRLHLRREEHASTRTTSPPPSARACACGRTARSSRCAARSRTAGYRYVVSAVVMDNDGDQPDAPADGHDRGDRVQGADPGRGRDGHAADPDALAAPALPSLSDRVGKHLGVNGDHVAGVEYDPTKITRRCSGCPATASSTRASRSRR